MTLLFSKTFEKNFKQYEQKLQKRIFNAIEALPKGDVKRLSGGNIPPIFRLRVSKYRILFHMNEEGIYILKIDSRGDVYK